MTHGVVLITKKDYFSDLAKSVAKIAFGEDLTCIRGSRGDEFPEDLWWHRPRLMLSFLSPWIIPKAVLDKAEIALNWHPASKDYPGIGCYNFALYDGAKEFGATCHFMSERVDTGAIIEERRFPIFEADSIETLKLRTMITMLAMFHDTVCNIARGVNPRPCGLEWSRKPYTRRELNDLTVIRSDMSEAEVRRRIKATTYPGAPGPSITVGGETFISPVPARPPLA